MCVASLKGLCSLPLRTFEHLPGYPAGLRHMLIEHLPDTHEVRVVKEKPAGSLELTKRMPAFLKRQCLTVASTSSGCCAQFLVGHPGSSSETFEGGACRRRFSEREVLLVARDQSAPGRE